MSNATFSNGHALIIGVGYDLPVTVKDATALRDVLIDPNRAAYLQDQVEILTENQANRQRILEAFDRLIEQVNKNPDATVIIYFSGHGGCIESLNGISEYFLVTYDYAQSRQSKQAISGYEFTKKIEAIKSRKLVVLLDCCHAAGMPAIKNTEEKFIKSPVPPSLLQVLDSGRGRVVIASSRENEKSYTGDPYSIFTTCLLEALGGKATRTQDGFARILDVLTYLVEQVPLKTSDSSKYRAGQQHPFVNNISNLDENFAICYYAGGSKFLPAEAIGSEVVLSVNSISDREKQKKRQFIQEELQHIEKLKAQTVKRMRKIEEALFNEVDPKLQDKYENDLETYKQQSQINQEKIDLLENQLSELD